MYRSKGRSNSIKVDRKLLIEHLTVKRNEALTEFKKAMEKYRAALAGYDDKLADALLAAANKARVGKLVLGTGYSQIPGIPDKPSKPTKSQACEIENLIHALRLSKEETLSLRDNSRYLQFACEL